MRSLRAVPYPATRLRRLRRTGALRGLARETDVVVSDLVMPLFVAADAWTNDGLPALGRHTVDGLLREVETLVEAGVPGVILFGVPMEKDDEGSGAWSDDGVVQEALRALRPRFPELVLLTDVCLCSYTTHGHCGVLEDGEIANDVTVELLARTAVSHADAGADAVGPSDMMDGRVGAIRAALDDAGHADVGSSRTPRSTRPPSTARSATLPTRPPPSATAAATSSTRRTSARRSASVRSTSRRARTC